MTTGKHMPDRVIYRRQLDTLRRKLEAAYAVASRANDEAEKQRLVAIATELDLLVMDFNLIALEKVARSIAAIAARIDERRQSIDQGEASISDLAAMTAEQLKKLVDKLFEETSEEDPEQGSDLTEPGGTPMPPENTSDQIDITQEVEKPGDVALPAGRLFLTEAHLIALWKRSQFPIDGRGIIVFGLRGGRPIDYSGTAFGPAHEFEVATLDYKTMNCIIGQWRPNKGLALFPGSTVPYYTAVEAGRRRGGAGVNQMGRGRYKDYGAGWHKRREKSLGHWALRQDCDVSYQRTDDDLDYDNEDQWFSATQPGDNIHCAFSMGPEGRIPDSKYSSAGCQVVAGVVSKGVRGSEQGPWKKFIQPFLPELGNQKSCEYVLLNAREAETMIKTQCRGKTVLLRYGSRGPLVRSLQKALGDALNRRLTVDGDFGALTFQAVIDFQTDVFGPNADDGIVGPDTAEKLGFALPEFDYDEALKPDSPGYIVVATDAGQSAGEGDADNAEATKAHSAGIAWGAVTARKHGPDFNTKVIAISKRIHCDPDHLMAVMAFETGEKFTPDVENLAGSGATGLIQFMPSTATWLGTTTAKLAAMTAIDQLDYVEAYFVRTARNRVLASLSDVYMTVLYPMAIGKRDSHVLFAKGTKEYRQNAGLDRDSDDTVTKAEAAAKVMAKLVKGLKENRIG